MGHGIYQKHDGINSMSLLDNVITAMTIEVESDRLFI